MIWRMEVKGVIHEHERVLLERVFSGETIPRPAPPPVAVAEFTPTYHGEVIDVDLAGLYTSSRSEYDRFVSNSEVQTFKRCRRKWWLAWHRGLTPINESPIGPRAVGNRLHRALQNHYVPGGPPSADALLDSLEREIMVDRSLLTDDTLADVRDQFEKDADLERIMLQGYLQWLGETGADSELDIVAAETYLEAPLSDVFGGKKVAVIGKIDVRVRRKLDGVRLFLDHKAIASISQATVMLPLDEQMLHYHFLESMQDGEEERCDGALYNMLRRVKRTARATPPFYDRVEVRHNRHELAAYSLRIHGEVEDILAAERQLEHGVSHNAIVYPRPTRDCTWDCPFFSVCPMFDDGSRAEQMVESLFKVQDPLEYYMNEVGVANE